MIQQPLHFILCGLPKEGNAEKQEEERKERKKRRMKEKGNDRAKTRNINMPPSLPAACTADTYYHPTTQSHPEMVNLYSNGVL